MAKPTTQAPAAQEVTAEKLISDVQNNALKAQQTYKGKRLHITGYVNNIDAQGEYFGVGSARDAFELTDVQAYITSDQRAKVAEFSKGQKVSFTGTVTDVGEIMGYSIKVESID